MRELRESLQGEDSLKSNLTYFYCYFLNDQQSASESYVKNDILVLYYIPCINTYAIS